NESLIFSEKDETRYLVSYASFSSHKLPRDQARVVTTEAEGVIDRGIDLHLSRRVGNVIQIAFWVRAVEIDRWRHGLLFDGLDADGHFHRARGAKHMACGAFRGADGNPARVVAKDGLDGLGFGHV